MQIVSNEVKSLLEHYAKVTLAVYIDGNLLECGISGAEYTPSCGSAEAFSIGNACAAGWKVSLAAARPDLKGRRIYVTWKVNGTEYPLFTGQVEESKVTAGRTVVEAWDDMYYGGSKAFIPSAVMYDEIDAAEVFSALAEAIGVSVEQETLDTLSGIMVTGLGALTEKSNSAVAGYIAGLIGGNAIMTRSGLLAIRLLSKTGWETEPYSGGASAENNDFYVTGITLQREGIAITRNADGTTGEESQTVEFAAGDGTLMLSNPLADQAAADRVFETLESLVFRPGSYSFPGGILLDPGDIITVKSMDGSYSVAAVVITMTFDGGVKTSVSCGGTVKSGGAAGTINQALQALTADFARLRQLVAENATIVSARITKLSADDIVAGRIRSTDYASVVLDELYPGESMFPSETVYPNNGEEIIRGFEIDFESGTIRGVFYSTVIELLSEKLDSLEDRVSALESLQS